MSIIASVYLKDAIIMSADSRITGEYRQKTEGIFGASARRVRERSQTPERFFFV